MLIRKVDASDDFEAIGNIYVASWQAAYRGIIEQDYLDSLNSARWAQSLSSLKYDSYVVMEDERYIGTSSIGAARDEKMPGWGEIISIYLLPEYFGRDYAAPLFEHVVEALTQAGYENIYLWALEDNLRARHFYEKHGFHANGDTALYTIGTTQLVEVRYVLGDFVP